MNNCKWLMIGSTTPCGKSCRSEFCGYHSQSAKKGSSNGPLPCLICKIGVRGKSQQLCLKCGGKKFRELKRYYDKRSLKIKPEHLDKNIDKIIKSPQDYIDRFIIEKSKIFDASVSNTNN